MKSKEGLVKRATGISEMLLAICAKQNVGKLAIEYPEFHGSTGGMMVARRGDLVKLTFTCGFLVGYLCRHVEVELVTVRQWKGQLPKAIVQTRIRRILGEEVSRQFRNDHEWDAVGVGLYVQGYLEVKRK